PNGFLDFSDVASHTHETLKEDLDLMLESLAAVGISEAIWVDLGKQEFGIPVARVVVPGLEAPHDDDDYVAGPRAREMSKYG
ncbi:MAG: YcaO-like family protein, partial [Roseibium sp.]|uniref:YcaO-like family protein n=1 Tax=Roseibium sp. TaxID=1936156 RepID=UPI0026082A55